MSMVQLSRWRVFRFHEWAIRHWKQTSSGKAWLKQPGTTPLPISVSKVQTTRQRLCIEAQYGKKLWILPATHLGISYTLRGRQSPSPHVTLRHAACHFSGTRAGSVRPGRSSSGGIRGTSHQKLYIEPGFCTLKERRKRHKLLMFHKMILGLCPQYMWPLAPFSRPH